MKLHQRLASDLRTRINRNGSKALGSIRELAEREGVAYATMWKALRLLQAEGVLTSGRGKRLAIREKPGESQSHQAVPESQRRFETHLRSAVIDGTCRAGDALPKLDHFCRTHHLSRPTVSAVLKNLARDNLIHKEGKRWVAGASVRKPHFRDPHSVGPTLLLLFAWNREMHAFYNNTHAAPFVHAFANEIRKCGLRTVVARETPAERGLPFPAGADGVMALVDSLGRWYSGTLIVHAGDRTERMDPIVPRLCRKGKPVVYFDHTHSGPHLTRGYFGGCASYFRAFDDDRGAVRAALGALHEAGHRRIGVPWYRPGVYGWMATRVENLRRAASQFSPPMAVEVADQTETFWRPSFEDPDYRLGVLAARLRKHLDLEHSGGSAQGQVVSHRRAFLDATPSLVSLFRKGVTALVALNDALAQEYYNWFVSAGVRVPKDISMVSFDNQPGSMVVPVSTVDFGFAQLGYFIAHMFIGDVRLPKFADGLIPGACSVIDRGSIGAPNERALRRIVG